MAISIAALQSAASRTTVRRSLDEARRLGAGTAFLCHSHQDAHLAKGLVQMLAEAGWQVYIDWLDTSMPDTPNRETALRIKQKIVDLDYFLFLATPRSMASRWCPWEIGYADGKKHIDRILVVPTIDAGQTHGNEYLQLYRRVDLTNTNELGVWQPGMVQGVFVRDL